MEHFLSRQLFRYWCSIGGDQGRPIAINLSRKKSNQISLMPLSYKRSMTIILSSDWPARGFVSYTGANFATTTSFIFGIRESTVDYGYLPTTS